MIPPSEITSHNIAFAGMLLCASTSLIAQTQALWIAIYLNGKLDISKSEEEISKVTILHSQFGKWRCPGGYGRRFPDFMFDALAYLDMLLGDLGLKIHRKRSWWREIFEAYGQEDYRGLIEEWKQKHENKLA